MAYPVLNAPYGLKPVNLVGGQVFSGSTRTLPIPYGYNTSIFNGDPVILAKGQVTRLTPGATATNVLGVFLGCSFTNPVTKQKTFSNYWPAGTAASDGEAIVCDDPDTVFKVVGCYSGTTVTGVAEAMVGQNFGLLDNSGSTQNGLSRTALSTGTYTTGNYAMTLIGVEPETKVTLGSIVLTNAFSTSGGTVTVPALPVALPVGAEVVAVFPDGLTTTTGAYVTAAAAAGATSLTVSAATATVAIGTTVIFVLYPEAYVKFNFGQHKYYNATGVA